MSTNKTPNYQLHSWLPSDEFHLTEINENFTLLDAALKSEAGSREAIAADLGTRYRIMLGTYVGGQSINHDTPQRIELGVKPIALLLYSTYSFSDSSSRYGGLICCDYDLRGSVTMDDTGFTVQNQYDRKGYSNLQGVTYYYMVFY
ncbi:MAG: hypothetical protein K2F83_01160 [Oscillospiraceae bacterium]|nr:hypothetical protein [Oscillospiraceae bacterium]